MNPTYYESMCVAWDNNILLKTENFRGQKKNQLFMINKYKKN